MLKLWHLLSSLFLAGIAIALVSCGTNNKLQSISVTPATANAKDYAVGRVQFTAAGTYTNGSQVKPLTVLWSPGPPAVVQPAMVVVDNNGVASCGSVPPGTYPVWAGAPADPHIAVSSMNQSTPTVSGEAQLTCP